METNGKLTLEQAEGNVKVAEAWLKAVNQGSFQGEYAIDIVKLLDFLTKLNMEAKKNYEDLKLGDIQAPEFGREAKA